MGKILEGLRVGLGFIVAIPIILIACIGYLLFVPFDMIWYHKMPYYKDLKCKYRFFITSADALKAYNLIAKKQLAIEYVKNNDYEYFIKDGQVLLCGWSNEDFEVIDGQWHFLTEEEGILTLTMDEALELDRALLKPEHRELPAKFLVFGEDITDEEKIEQARNCPYFDCIFLMDEAL